MKRISIFLLCIFFFAEGKSDNDLSKKYLNRKTLGGIIETGIPIYRLKEGTVYAPVLFIANYHQPLFKAKKFCNVALDFSPQIGFAAGKQKGMEAGLNVAFLLCFGIKKSVISLQAGTGPHYFSYPTSRQAKGFLFADNFLFEYRREITPAKMEINFYAGFRHISNLNIQLPNGGVNNAIVGFGFSKIF